MYGLKNGIENQALINFTSKRSVSEIYLVCSIHLGIEAYLFTIFIGAKTPWLPKINTYFQQQNKLHVY